MGHKMWVLGLAALMGIVASGASAQEPDVDIELSEPEEGEDATIFDSLQIELLDIDRLRERVEETLVGEPMRITLDETIRMALEHNQDILIVGFEPSIADSELFSSRGDFDPNLTISGSYSDSSDPPSPTTRAFGGFTTNIESRVADGTLSLNGRNWIGTQYDFEVFVERERGTFTTPRDPDTGDPLSPLSFYTMNVGLTLTQPLLRGFGTDSNLVRVRTALNNLEISDAEVEFTLINTIGQVTKAYWDLVGAVEQVKVQQEALANARRVLRINEQRYELGTAAALEVLEAKAGVAARQSDLIAARTAVLDAEDILKNFMGLYDESGELLSSNSLIPIDRPVIETVEWNLKESQRTALAYRPDIRQAEIAVDNADLEIANARDQLLPSLDLTGSYGRSSRKVGGSDIFEGILQKDGRSWTIALEGSIPIGNRAARGNFTRAKLIRRQQQQRLRKTKLDAQTDVRLAVHSLASNRVLVESTQQTRRLEEANVAAEERRLRIGVTTAQDVLDKQEDLTAAQAREVQALVDFEKSRVDLLIAEGTLLEEMQIEYQEPEYGEDIGFFESLGPVSAED